MPNSLSRILIGGFAAIAISTSASAQGPEFQEGKVRVDGQDYPYQLLVPSNLEEGKRYPLILFLHGAGERGNDNQAQIRHFPGRMKRLQEENGEPCFVLAPQCPKGVWWTGKRTRGSSGVGADAPIRSMRAAMVALANVVRERPIDLDRMALTGLSMGGYGSWSMATRYPSWFSAVVPICGGGDESRVSRLAGLPLQVWHGDADTVVPPDQSRRMVKALKRLNIPVEYHELEGVRHNSWSTAYGDGSCLALLFKKRRNPIAVQKATAAVLAGAIAKEERIAFLGDSITQSGAQENGYVDLIRKGIAKARPDAVIIPAGISGHKVPDLLKRYQKDVLDKKPTMVFIYIGINDVWHSQNGRGTPIEEYEAGLRKLVREFRAAGAQVVLATPSVIGEKPEGENELDKMLLDYAAVSRKVAASEGATLCDLRQAFLDHLMIFNPKDRSQGILTSDGVHLNAEGNLFVASEAARALFEAKKMGGE
ncbi:MAG: GDSL-type esterase/lipase family protein [Planctomycetota bacterium]|jgi:lysophospholipase L1-like esterase/pimeloyl-ACP methyl ester carboxylesterase|nr:GDSL-type esterase/lipase family protein [Planctomycetota bacterium]